MAAILAFSTRALIWAVRWAMLLKEHTADVPAVFRQIHIGIVDDLREARQVSDALGGDMAELVEM